MGKNKKRAAPPSIDEALDRPWCFYCERDFDDLRILISHQRAKHFKCGNCNRRLNTIGGLSVHMNQVHKEPLTEVEGALPNRGDVSIEIFGMEGIPEDIMQAHVTRVTQMFFGSDQHRANAGNPPPGGQHAPKRQKMETPEELKKRLEEFKAKRKAREAGLDVGDNTPVHASDSPAYQAPDSKGFALPSASPPPVLNPSHPPAESSFKPHYPPPADPGFQQSYLGQGYSPYAPQRGGWLHTPFSSHAAQNSGPPHMTYNPATAPTPLMPPFHPPTSDPPMPSPGPPMSGAGPPMSAPGMSPGLPQPSLGLPQRPAFAAPNLSKEEMAKMHSGMSQPMTGGAPTFNGPPPQQVPRPREEISDDVDEHIRSITGGSKDSYLDPPMRALAPPTDSPVFDPDRRAKLQGFYPNGNPAKKSHPSFSPSIKAEPTDEETGATFGNHHTVSQDVAVKNEPGVGNGETSTPAPMPPTPSQDTKPAATPTGDTTAKTKKKKSKHQDESNRLVYSDRVSQPEEKMAHAEKYHFDRNTHEKTQTVLGDIGAAVTGGAGDTVRDPADRGV